MLFVTTSHGVYRCDPDRQDVQRVLDNSAHRSLFKARSRGFFGIARHDPSGHVLVASRERDDTFLGKLVTRVKLHLINPESLRAELLATLDDVHDVHQIAWHDGHVFLTDTGRNRLIVWNPANGQRLVANIGTRREDANHVNAVVVHDRRVFVGLNNHGTQPAAVLHMPLARFMEAVKDKNFDLATAGEYMELDNVLHSHDLEPVPGGGMLACKSHDGVVLDITRQHNWLEIGGWTRGLAFDPGGLWVGTSKFADRKKRHNEKLDGSVSRYTLPDLGLEKCIALHGAGQVNDLLYVADKSETA